MPAKDDAVVSLSPDPLPLTPLPGTLLSSLDRGREFELGILRVLQERYDVTTVARDYREIRSLDRAEATFEAMRRGVPIIYQGVLWDAHNKNYGSPDFLVRSDILRLLFPESISEQEAEISAPDLGTNLWHYLVVDTKFTTLHLNARGTELTNEGSAPAYKAQLYIYNRILGRLQGFEPPGSYLLGRGWQRTQSGVTYRARNAMEQLGPVPQNGKVANGVPIADAVEEALGWVRRVRTEGEDWELLPTPSVPELYPNMSNADDGDMMLERRPAELEPGPEEDEQDGKWGWRQEVVGERVERVDPIVASRSRQTQKGPRRWMVPLGRTRPDAWRSGHYRA